jgi:hypothetical protein
MQVIPELILGFGHPATVRGGTMSIGEWEQATRECTERVAKWMIAHSFATGHGDTLDDLLSELEWQVMELRTPSEEEL